MATTITITVNSLPSADQLLDLHDSIIVDPDHLKEVWKAARIAKGQTIIGADVNQCAFHLHKALNIDYNSTLLYTITFLANVVTITANNPSSQFSEATNTTAGAVTVVINNEPVVTPITIDSVTVAEEVGSACSDVEISITTSEQADNMNSPLPGLVSSNPHVITFPRQDSIMVSMQKDSFSDTKYYRIPLLLSAYIDIDVVGTPSGSTVTANRLFPLSDLGSNPLLLTFEYSLDNVIWQSSNSWSGIADGAQTLYVRDNIGCSISIPFTIDAFTANLIDFDPIAEISNANSFRFKCNEVWANCGTRKNLGNALSFEEDSQINRRDYLQPFQKCDIIKTQIKSNYTTNTAKLVDCDDVETPLTVTKVTNNMDITDVRDGKVINLPSGLLGIYFGSGTTYDPDTLLENGSYNLLEILMDWVNIGDYMNVEGVGWAAVTNIIAPTTDFQYYIAELGVQNDLGYADDTVIKITTVYNNVDFERFEFAVDMSALEGSYKVVVNITDANVDFPDIEFISEWINIKEEYSRHHLIDFFSTKNNEINYGTGITGRVRMPYVENLPWTPADTQEIYTTDTKTVNLDSEVREFYQLNLMPIPTAMAQKMVLVLAHNRVFIDGINYLLEGEVESTRIGQTNTYNIKANLVKSDYVFSNTQGVTAGEVLSASGVPLNIDGNASGLLFIE